MLDVHAAVSEEGVNFPPLFQGEISVSCGHLIGCVFRYREVINDFVVVILRYLVASAVFNEVRVGFQMHADSLQGEVSTGLHELLLDCLCATHDVHRAVIIDPDVGCSFSFDLLPGVTDPALRDLCNETVHAFFATTVPGDNVLFDF